MSTHSIFLLLVSHADKLFLPKFAVSKSQGWGRKRLIGKEGVAKIIDDTYR